MYLDLEEIKSPDGFSFSIIVMIELGKLTWNEPINGSINDYLSIQEDVIVTNNRLLC